jgi:hypothetical protein
MDLSQGIEAGAHAGNLFPEVRYAVTGTTKDSLSADVSAAFDLPIDFDFYLGTFSGALVFEGGRIAEFVYPSVHLHGGTNTAHLYVTLRGGETRRQLEDFISAYAFQHRLRASVDAALIDPRFTAPVPIKFNFTLPPSAGGNDTDLVRCVELTSINYSLVDVLLLKCQLDCVVDAWFHNPLPLPLSLNSLQYDVYFDDPDGALCVAGVCYYPPKDSVFFTHVQEPGSTPPEENALPLTLTPGETGKTAMHMSGFSNELCFRLRDQYNQDNLTLSVQQGSADVVLGDFPLTLRFDFPSYRLGGDNDTRPCWMRARSPFTVV